MGELGQSYCWGEGYCWGQGYCSLSPVPAQCQPNVTPFSHQCQPSLSPVSPQCHCSASLLCCPPAAEPLGGSVLSLAKQLLMEGQEPAQPCVGTPGIRSCPSAPSLPGKGHRDPPGDAEGSLRSSNIITVLKTLPVSTALGRGSRQKLQNFELRSLISERGRRICFLPSGSGGNVLPWCWECCGYFQRG